MSDACRCCYNAPPNTSPCNNRKRWVNFSRQITRTRLIRRYLLINDSLVSRAIIWKAIGPGLNLSIQSPCSLFFSKNRSASQCSLHEGTPLIYSWIMYCCNRKTVQEFLIQFNPLYQPSADVISIIRYSVYRVTHFNLFIKTF